ncbi:MAG: murein biosynthesis integral membrane protein MurJ [Tissierellia bacterium]|nr:murein biosynthesis integral membrane protein MurJ [Tissierellia bacterium]
MSVQPKTIARSTMIIIILSLIGKLMGFGRESLVAAVFGANMEKDAFVAAQSATSTVSQYIVMGISTVFIPGLQSVTNDRGESGKLKYTSNIFFVVALLTLLIMGLGTLGAPFLAKLVGPKFDPATKALTVELIRLAMPVIIFSALQGIFTGYLHFHNRFAAAASVSIWLNSVYLSYLVFFAKDFGIYGLTVASVLAVVVEFIVVYLASHHIGFRLKPYFSFSDPYTRQTLILALPAIITVSVNNINTLVNRALASGLATGSMSRLDYANKLNVLIIGIFITAITSVIFPPMAKAFDEGDYDRGKRIMNGSIRSVLLITIPSVVGLIILAQPVVELAFMRGAFTQADADATAVCLRFYTLSLIAISVTNVQNRVFYSLEDTKTPFYIGMVNVACNVGLNLLLVSYMGINGLAFSVSVATTVVMLVSFYLIRKKIGNIGMTSYLKVFIKTGLAALFMGLVVYLVYFMGLEPLVFSQFDPGKTQTLARLLVFLLSIFIGVIVYGLALYGLGLKEAKDIKIYLERKLRARFGTY